MYLNVRGGTPEVINGESISLRRRRGEGLALSCVYFSDSFRRDAERG